MSNKLFILTPNPKIEEGKLKFAIRDFLYSILPLRVLGVIIKMLLEVKPIKMVKG